MLDARISLFSIGISLNFHSNRLNHYWSCVFHTTITTPRQNDFEFQPANWRIHSKVVYGDQSFTDSFGEIVVIDEDLESGEFFLGVYECICMTPIGELLF